MTQTLEGRRALVTGGSGGIGRALVQALAERGADVAVHYAGGQEAAAQAADDVRAAGRRSALLQADLADPAAASRLVERAERELGPLDLLVANAGTGVRTAWDAVDLDLWQRTLAVNLTAPWVLAQAALPGMLDRGWGRVLLVSSVAAINGGVVGPHYAASKAGLHGLVAHLAPRVAARGVTVNALAPALITGTGMLPSGGDTPPLPVGRNGTPAEVAQMAVAMLENGYLTGKVVALDGGLTPP